MKESGGSRGSGMSMRAGPGIGRSIGSVGTISRGPSAEGRSGFSSRSLSVPSSRISNPGLKVTSYINPSVRRNEAFAPFGLSKSPEKSFVPSDQASPFHRSKNTEKIHRRRPGRSFHQDIPTIKHNKNYEAKIIARPIAPVIERIPTQVKRDQPELFTPYYTLLKKELKKAGGTTPKVLDKMLSHELNTRKDEVKNFESLVRTEKVKAQIIELPRLPLDRIDNLTPQLRLARLRQVKTATNRRTQLKPGLSLESSTALKTKTDLLSSTDVQKNNDLLTVTELMMPIALRARPDQLSEEEKTKEIVLFELKKLPDRPEEKDEDEPQRLDQDTQANEARKEIIIKAIEWSKIKAKQKDEAITGKDVNLPKKPSGDTLSELARDLGLEHDGSWSALVYAMQAVGKIDHKIDKFIQSAIDNFTAVRRRKRPFKPATKENAQLVVTGGISIDEDTFKSKFVA